MLESSLWSLLSLATTSSPSGNPVGSIFLTLFLQNPSPVLASALPPAWARPLWHVPEFLQHPHPRGLSASLLVPLRLVWTSSRVSLLKPEVSSFGQRHKNRIMSFCIHILHSLPVLLIEKAEDLAAAAGPGWSGFLCPWPLAPGTQPVASQVRIFALGTLSGVLLPFLCDLCYYLIRTAKPPFWSTLHPLYLA